MLLHQDWKKILRHAWSVRLLALAAVLSGLEVVAPMIVDKYGDRFPWAPWLSALALFLIIVAAFGTRFVAQKQFGAE